MRIRRKKKKLRVVLILSTVLFFICITVLALLLSDYTGAPHNPADAPIVKNKKTNTSTPKFNKSLYSTSDASSLWVVVNKPHGLSPTQYQPASLISVGGQTVSTLAASQLRKMITSAQTQGIALRVISGYRSYSYQDNLYNSYVAKDGQPQADTYSARPGHSEHQTGLAVDIGGVHGCDVQQCFGDTIEGKWLAANAGKYGFLIRYTAANQSVTGYQSEPWHLRYIGSDLANEMNKKGITTLEQFFGINGGNKY